MVLGEWEEPVSPKLIQSMRVGERELAKCEEEKRRGEEEMEEQKV